MRWWINGIGQFTLGILGFLTNSVSISILIRRELSTTFNHLLACLAFSDNMHYICSVAMAIITLTRNGSIRGTYFPQFHSVWFMCSAYIFLGLATERYFAISNLRNSSVSSSVKKSSWKRVLLYTTPVLLFTLIFHMPSFMEIKFGEFNLTSGNKTSNQTITWMHTDLRKNEAYIFWYKNVLRVFFRGILPFGALMFANFKLVLAIRNLRKYPL